MGKEAENQSSFRGRLHEIIFESDTRAGKFFDLALVSCILISVSVTLLDSIKEINLVYEKEFFYLDWFFTVIFTLEYLLRIYVVNRPFSYIFSAYGMIDFFAIFPSYLSVLIPNTRYFSVIRVLRVLRIFRILKLAHYLEEGELILKALKSSRRRIQVFVFSVFLLVIIIGSLIYVIEGEKNGFTSIPISIYWAIVTLTTVGYGDISPVTPLGQALSALIMIIGYGIIAIPTGIVTAEMISSGKKITTQVCKDCNREGHDEDAVYCKYCGKRL
ncbi:MAG: ion transporter [Candidatus Rifleibacteriota bacterium]